MLRAIIIDDEQAGIDLLKVLIERNSETVRLVASTVNPREGISLIGDYRPDVVFLDVSMPDLNGFELLAHIREQDFLLVFTTAHRDFALEAIRHRAFDYLLKPVDSDDFTRCVAALAAEKNKGRSVEMQKRKQIIELQTRDGISYIRPHEIVRLEASRSYTIFHLDGSVRHVASRPLKDFESKLDAGIFYRCHNSHIVNLHKVQKFVNHQGYFALMNDGSMADIARKYKDPFLDRLKSL
jgi:two-component system, LytTR family, response regulator